MKHSLRLTVPAAVLLLAACGSPDPAPTSTATVDATTAVAAPNAPCKLKSTGDVLLRTKDPTLPWAVQLLGDVNVALCRSTADFVRDTMPPGPGHCYQLAREADNPGRVADDGTVTSTGPLKKVFAHFGTAC